MKERDEPKPGMFRGEALHVWQRRLQLRGYPEDKARLIAEWVTTKGVQPPKWEDLIK